MLVTIITDASHCPKTKAAGYGFWTISGRGSYGGGGELKGKVRDCHVAELMALVNTVVISVKSGIAGRNDVILLQSDSIRALGLIKGSLQPNNNDEKKATEYLKNYVSLHDLSIKVRHVKGHDDSNRSSRSVTNKLCDMRAKEHMYAVRIKFLKREGNA